MFAMRVLCMGIIACQCATLCRGQEDQKVFLIGNSLTMDTLPALLGNGVQWHIDCGKNLQYIHDHPQKPCVKSSYVWTLALAAEDYDVLCVQPHFGTSLTQDVAVISSWLRMQPQARLLIHTGWNRSQDFESVYHAELSDDHMSHTPGYFDRLVTRLRQDFPGRDIQTTGMIQVFDEIFHEIQAGQTPFTSFAELYRDEIHLKNQVGRYLAHNLMRIALNRPISDRGFQMDSAHEEYFNRKLVEYRNQHASNASARLSEKRD